LACGVGQLAGGAEGVSQEVIPQGDDVSHQWVSGLLGDASQAVGAALSLSKGVGGCPIAEDLG
jgi:hypothetical protein